jgi:DNA polymerase-4
MADDVWDWVEKTGQHGRTVTVKAKYADFRIVTRSRTLTAPVADRATLHATARSLIATLYPLRMGLRLVGVTMAGFGAGEAPSGQLDLL